MFRLIAQNQYGQSIELTHNPAYGIKSVTGLDPPDSNISTVQNGTIDGSEFKSARTLERVITITLAINGPAESNRIALYRYFKSKFPVRIYYSNSTRNVYIDGYVRSMSIAFFDKKQVVQIVIQCPRPNFNDAEESLQQYETVQSLFEFPFSIPAAGIPFSGIQAGVEKSIINDGDLETGVQITITATGTVQNPKIYFTDAGTHMIINTTLESGDVIRIDTREGHKAITLTSGGVTSNLIGSLEYGSTWLNLVPGDNLALADADSGAELMLVTFLVVPQFEGV